MYALNACLPPWEQMSIVTLQLGQCGNQLGVELFNVLGSDLLSARTNASDFCFREMRDGHFTPRCLLVDMEPKVVDACVQKSRLQSCWAYDPANVIVQQSGSGVSQMPRLSFPDQRVQLDSGAHSAGNNWALGYNRHGSRCAEFVVESARREVERCDYFGGFLLLQSLAGGTGAGLGSRVAEELGDRFPSALKLSYGIWPFDTGEVLVQAYNAILSVSKLLEVCEGVTIVRNEDLHKTCVVCHQTISVSLSASCC